MHFETFTDDQLAKLGLIPDGQYQFEVVDAQEKQSAKGNPMIQIKLKIWDGEGKLRFLNDWLMPSFPKKLKHFCRVTGMEDKYNLGTIYDKDCLNKSGVVDIAIGKNNKGEDWNTVVDYLVKTTASVSTKKDEEMLNDDIPF